MKILALDMASVTGYCIIENAKLLVSGAEDFTKKRGESNGILFLKFAKFLETLSMSYGYPDVVSYERAHFRGGAATEICVGLQTHAQSFAAKYNIEITSYHTSIIKKAIVGNGRASKDDVIAAIKERYNLKSVKDDNEADAIAIATSAWQELGVISQDPF